MFLGPLLIILRIGQRKSYPAVLKCWQNRSFWKREDKCKKGIGLKTFLIKQGHSLTLFLEIHQKTNKQNPTKIPAAVRMGSPVLRGSQIKSVKKSRLHEGFIPVSIFPLHLKKYIFKI